MGIKSHIKKRYIYWNKYFLIITALLLIASCTTLGVAKVTTGSFVHKGVSLTGGTEMRVPVDLDFSLQRFNAEVRADFPEADFRVREVTREGQLAEIIIEVSGVTEDDLESFARSYFGPDVDTSNVRQFGASISEAFFRQIVIAVLVALVLMGIVVYITFRDLVPSLFVILAAVSTIITTLAVTVLLNIRLQSAGIAAFLMLIGYSVDTDILLTTRVLKRQEGGSINDKIFYTMRTGLTMTLSSLAAVFIAYVFTNNEIIGQITLILSIGLFFDMVYTWLQNAVILKQYMTRKRGGQ